MKEEILDEGFFTNVEIKSLEDIKHGLRSGGINSFYEHKDGSIIVQEGDAVKVAIRFENQIVSVKPKFPRIGNSIQVTASAVLLAIFIFIIAVPFPIQWIIAIAGGQIVSYLYHSPKTKRLQERIENYLKPSVIQKKHADK